MGIIKYTADRKFNLNQATTDGWGIEWAGEKSLIGTRLQDRKKSSHRVEITSTDWFMGILRVFYKDGSWQCFDHCIEQFELEKLSNNSAIQRPVDWKYINKCMLEDPVLVSYRDRVVSIFERAMPVKIKLVKLEDVWQRIDEYSPELKYELECLRQLIKQREDSIIERFSKT